MSDHRIPGTVDGHDHEEPRPPPQRRQPPETPQVGDASHPEKPAPGTESAARTLATAGPVLAAVVTGVAINVLSHGFLAALIFLGTVLAAATAWFGYRNRPDGVRYIGLRRRLLKSQEPKATKRDFAAAGGRGPYGRPR
jgi:hypothetical protein